MHIHRLFSSVISTVSISCLLAGCASSAGEPQAAAEETPAITTLETFKLTKANMTSTLSIPGELLAYQQVDLYAKVNSFVKKLYADVGSVVTAGQLLAVMEAPELNSQLLGAESRLKSQEAVYQASKATYQRLLETSKTPGTVSQNDLDLALAKQNSDLAQLQAAQAAFNEIGDTKNYLEIRAPFPGIITTRNVSTGAYVGPSGKGSDAPLFTLQEQEKLRLVISVPERYAGYLAQNDEASFSVKAFPTEQFHAKISRLAGALDSRLRAQRVEMDVDNHNKQLLPGMIAEVKLPLANDNQVYAVPSEAVLNATLGTFVIKIENDSTKWVPVTLGRQTDGMTEIYGPLDDAMELVKSVSEEIRDQEPVNPH